MQVGLQGKVVSNRWYQKFDALMRLEGYSCSLEDPCLYTCKAIDGKLIVLILYVNDMSIVGRSGSNVDALKHRLHETFSVKDLGEAVCIVGMWITHDHSCMLLFLSTGRDYFPSL